VLNWSAAQIQEACDTAAANGLKPPTGAQLAYSVLHRAHVEDEAMRRACGSTVGIVASYSLQGGLLTGKYRSGGPADGRLTEWLNSAEVLPMLPKVDRFVALAEQTGCTPSQLAMAYCLKNAQVSSVLFGARKVAQVRDNVGALEVVPRLSDGIMSELRAL
jgi:aryl-alcohol dehydrogenase-like predicted oxidoreductase